MHKLATKTKSSARYVYDEVRGGMRVLFQNQNMNFAFAGADGGKPILSNVMNSKEISKRIDEVVSRFSFRKNLGGSKGSGDAVGVIAKGTGKEYKNYKAVEYTGTTKVNGEERDISRRVFQRIDIDYKRINPDSGMTN